VEADRNLLAAALAFRAGLIDPERLAQACAVWAEGRDRSMLEVLAERGWIDEAQRADVEAQILEASMSADETVVRAAPEAVVVSVATPVVLAEADAMPFPTEPVAHAPKSAAKSNNGHTSGLERTHSTLGFLEPTDYDGQAPLHAGHDETVDFRTEPDPGASDGDMRTVPDAMLDHPSHAGHVLLSTVANVGESRTQYAKSKLHAKGGMGQVWLARDLELGRDVALKELRPDQAGNPQTRHRFLSEARITGQLEHPSIVPVYELVADPGHGQPFYTMRMVRGRTLSRAIAHYHDRRKKGTAAPLELARLLNAFVAVCQAIAYAHSRGIIHRDLKGQNVVLGDFGEVMVLDWGLAKSVGGPETVTGPAPTEFRDDPLTRTIHGQVMGTPAYMSPEQAAGRLDLVGPLSDVYGLGAVLAELLTGEPPFTGRTTKELLKKVREEAPVPPRKVNPQAPAALEAVCLKAMAKDPAERYASAADLAREVEHWLADEPVSAYPDPLGVRLARWSRRHRSVVAAAAALVTVATVSLGVGYVLVRAERDEAWHQRAQAQLQRAEAQRQRAFARQAAEDMYSEFGQYWLEDFLDPVQRQTLEKAREAFARFDQEQAGEPNSARQRGRANARLATIAQKLGDLDGAEGAFRTAEGLLSEQAARHDATPEDRRELIDEQVQHARLLTRTARLDVARSLLEDVIRGREEAREGPPELRQALGRAAMALGDVHRLAGQADKAESAFARALDELRDAATAAGSGFEARNSLATALEGQGMLRLERGKLDDAEVSLREALEVAGPLLAQFPTVALVRDGLARTQNTLGRVLEDRKDAVKARAAYEASAQQYQRLTEDFPLRPEYQRGLARAYLNLGNLLFVGNGQDADAERAYRRAIAMHEALGQSYDDFKYGRDLARAYTNLGTLALQQGREDDAEKAFWRSDDLMSSLLEQHPELPELQASKALLVMKRGDLGRARQDFQAAATNYDRAVADYQDLIDRHPDVARYRREQAQCLNNLALARKSTGQLAEAERALRRALSIYDEQYRQTKQAAYLPLMASSHTNLGELRLPGAEDDYRQSLALFRQVVQANPRQPRYQENLATALINLAAYLDEKKNPDADALFVEAVERLNGLVTDRPEGHRARYLLGSALGRQAKRLEADDPNRAAAMLQTAIYHEQRALDEAPRVADYREELLKLLEALARARLEAGDYPTAEALAATMCQVGPWDGDVAIRSARLLALASQAASADTSRPAEERERLAEALAAQAVERLTAAARLGNNVRSLASDEDLKSLRGRDDFKAATSAGD
jgi:serine/threonine-protein kinase